MKYPLLNHLCKLKKIKGPIQNPVVHQQKLVPMMNVDHEHYSLMSVLKKILQQCQKHTCCTNTFHFVDEPFMPYSIKGYTIDILRNLPLTCFGEEVQSKDA